MTRLEMVEKLKEKTGATYEEAKAALEESSWDIFDAMLALGRCTELQEEPEPKRSKLKSAVSKADGVIHWICSLIQKGEQFRIEITRDGETVGSFSLTVLVFLLLIKWWLAIGLLLLGLFVGFRYRIPGHAAAEHVLNSAQEKAAAKAEKLKSKREDD